VLNLLAAVFVTGMALLMSGCYDPLFPADAPRTQFEIYDRMRDNYAPADEPDVFGRPKPALRQRLTES
jgi:hypothetical protein